MKKLMTVVAIVAVLGMATVASATPGVWEYKAGISVGSDLVSDGTTLYRVGGLSDPDGLYEYDGPDVDTWTQLADNPQTYDHRSPGENNQVWVVDGKIVCSGISHKGHPGGNVITTYDIGTDTWTDHGLPEFVGGDFEHHQWPMLNGATHEFHVRWKESDAVGTTHPFASGILENLDGTPNWKAGTPFDSTGPTAAPAQAFMMETSDTTAFDYDPIKIAGEWRGIRVRMYDYATQPADFSGTWTHSAIYDIGVGGDVRSAGNMFGTDVMAWDPVTGKLYVVTPGNNYTMAYDPVNDSWTNFIDQYAGGVPYRSFTVAVADGWIYARGNTVMGAFELPGPPVPEPAALGLIGLAALAMRRRRS